VSPQIPRQQGSLPTQSLTFIALLSLSLSVSCEPVKPAKVDPSATTRTRGGGAPSGRPSPKPFVGKRLELDDLFGPKSLAGRPPGKIKWSADGAHLYYLRPSATDARVLDLWQIHTSTGKASVLVTAASLRSATPVKLTEAQKAARERRRVRSRGITSFLPDKAGRGIVLPVGGMLHHYDPKTGQTRRLLKKPGGELDPKPSPDGKSLAFVRSGNLWVMDLATGRQRALTKTGKGTLSNGVAEFVAAEELDRHTGYWWSPDSKRIAYAEVDESMVQVVQRPEIHATRTRVVRQRYPAAGTPNAKVRLGVANLATGQTTWVDLGPAADRYLARVRWVKTSTPEGTRVAVQTLARDQRTLMLRLADPTTGKSRVVLTERDPRYINLHKDLRPLKNQPAFVWSSESGGSRQVGLYDWTGKLLRPLTAKPLFIHKVVGLDEEGGALYATVPTGRGKELHLYRFALDGKGAPRRISKRRGWHQVTFSRKSKHYVDRYSALSTPPQVRLHRADGSVVQTLDANAAKRYRSFTLAQSRFVEIPTEGGTILNGLLLHPLGADPHRRSPAIIYTYGGPHGRSVANRWRRMEPWHQYLAQRGFVVLVVDGRGTAYRGKTFETKLHMQFGRVDVADITAAARWLGSRPGIDKNRLGLWGWSYGGYLTVTTLLRTGKLFAAGVAVAPVADWTLYDTAYTERYLGHPRSPAAKKAYAQSNPVRFAKGLQTHLLLIHGMADDNVLLQHTLMLAQAFQKHGRRFDLMLYPGKKHSIKGTATRKHLLGGLLDYFQRHLQK
jgi:dipeptidyl-peptidase 4